MGNKPNAFLAKLEAQNEHKLKAARLHTMQQCKDIMMIAANDAFGFGADRLKMLSDAYDAAFVKYAEIVMQDVKDDREIWYAKDVLDNKLRQICGEYFAPWEERYK